MAWTIVPWRIVEGSIVEAESQITITDGITTEVLSLPPCVDELGLRILAQGQCEQKNLERKNALQDVNLDHLF